MYEAYSKYNGPFFIKKNNKKQNLLAHLQTYFTFPHNRRFILNIFRTPVPALTPLHRS